MRGGNDEAVLVVGDGHGLIHVLHHLGRETHALDDLERTLAVDHLAALERTHGNHPLQRLDDRLLVARRQQVGQVTHRNAQALHVGDDAAFHRLVRHLLVLGCALDRRQRRDVPHHRQCPVFRVQREGHFPVHCHPVHRRLAGRRQPRLGDALLAGSLDHVRIVRIQEALQLGLVQLLLVRHGGGSLDAVGVIQHHAQIADTAHAGLGTDRGLARLDPRIAEQALLGLARLPVEVDLLVRAARDAHPPAAALVLVHQHDAVLFALVHRTRRARGHAGRVQAVLAQARQVHHEGVLEGGVHLLLHPLEQVILAALAELAGQIVLPVRTPLDLVHLLAGQHRHRPCRRRRLHPRRRLQVLVVVGERLVVVVDRRQVRVGKQVRQNAQLAPLARLELAARGAHPAPVPLLLVLPLLGIADTGLGLDVVEPGVFHAITAGPDVLAGHRAGVATDALVQIQHHSNLCTNFHQTSPCAVSAFTGSSIQSTFDILRSSTNSSRLLPMVP